MCLFVSKDKDDLYFSRWEISLLFKDNSIVLVFFPIAPSAYKKPNQYAFSSVSIIVK